MCCLQEVRWRGCGARLIGVQGRRYELCWSGNEDGYGGVGVLTKEELYDKVAEVRRVNDSDVSCHRSSMRSVVSGVHICSTKWKSMEEKGEKNIYQENGPLITQVN